MKARRTSAKPRQGGYRAPFLKGISTLDNPAGHDQFPFNIPAFSQGIHFDFENAVTLFVGENGSGKSTLLEAIAQNCGFNVEGGNRNHRYSSAQDQAHASLAALLRMSWLPKVTEGFFLRAESFFNFATYLDGLAQEDSRAYSSYGGKSLHAQSHGESFLSLFLNRLGRGLYILDEPEAALSPQRQLSFLRIIHDLDQAGQSQFLIATHAPILLAYPGAAVLNLSEAGIQSIDYRQTEHFQMMKAFLESPERFFRHLFAEE